MVNALTKKLGRDLRSQAGQVLTVAAVIGCGIAAYVSMRGCWKSLETSRDAFYQQYRFGDVFAHLTRAPTDIAQQLRGVPDVAMVQTRLVEPARIPMPGMPDPARAWIVSLPADASPQLGSVWIREGRPFDPGRDEALLLSSFADAHDVRLGDRLSAIVRGERHEVRVVGIADSPEHLFPVVPGELMPDASRVAVLWMDEAVVAPMVQMEGAFDDVLIRLQPGATAPAVLRAVDRILERYGGTGAVTREHQLSHRMLEQEMAQLRLLATMIPAVFLAVAAFLLDVILGRMLQLQRTQIATLKAFGYTRAEIARHYLGFAASIAVLGALIGLGLGARLGRDLTGLYAGYFHLPAFRFQLDGELLSTSLGVSVAVAIVAVLRTVLQVTGTAPAVAMQPPAPAAYTRSFADRAGMTAMLPLTLRMTIREVVRQPTRFFASVLGLGFATAVVVFGRFSGDVLVGFEDILFEHVLAEDVQVVFDRPLPERAVRTVAELPEVRYGEGQRTVAARFRSGHRWRDGVLVAHPTNPRLRRVMSWPLSITPVPDRGIVLTDVLCEMLGVRVGDPVDVELLYEDHRRATVPVVGLVREPVGLQGHVHEDTLAGWLDEAPLATDVFLTVEPGADAGIRRRLSEMPGVLGTSSKASAQKRFHEQTARTRTVMTAIASAFGAAISIGIVYNNARITLGSHAREFATLRVLGFTRDEVSAIVLLEQALQVTLAIPLGFALGRVMVTVMMRTVDPETWRFPTFVASRTYAFAAVIVLVTTAGSAWFIRRFVNRLDLIATLKTRE